jgi:hypothetical protein
MLGFTVCCVRLLIYYLSFRHWRGEQGGIHLSVLFYRLSVAFYCIIPDWLVVCLICIADYRGLPTTANHGGHFGVLLPY